MVCPVEALKDVREVVLGDSRAAITDGDADM